MKASYETEPLFGRETVSHRGRRNPSAADRPRRTDASRAATPSQTGLCRHRGAIRVNPAHPFGCSVIIVSESSAEPA